ncbi:hypothetical protein NQZ79_g4159 [Umbelopsis isabellina]|nr:hypothetical protein NQZ79_g4159 [Umbelopsis isabellina]
MFGKSKNFNSKFQFDLSQFTNNAGGVPELPQPNFGASLPAKVNGTNGRDTNPSDMNANLNGTTFKFEPFQFKPPQSSFAAPAEPNTRAQQPTKPSETFVAAALNPVCSQAIVFNAAKLPKEIESHHTSNTTVAVHDWNRIYHGRLTFYESTAKVFESLHDVDTNLHNGKSKNLTNGNFKSYKDSSLHSYAAQYTKQLLNYQKLLNNDVRKEADAERKTIRTFIAVWHLCEILFFSKQKQAPIAKELVEWLNGTDKSGLLKYDSQRIIHHPDPCNHPEFWDFVYKLLLRGQMQAATTLLTHAVKTISAKSLTTLNKLITVLTSMPELYTNYSTTVENRYNKQRSKWLKDVVQFKETLQQNTDTDTASLTSQTLNLLNLLEGDRKSILEHSGTRHEAIVAIALYSCPTSSRPELPEIVQSVDEKFPISSGDTALEACRAFMMGDIYEAIVTCASEDWWLVAHLTDLLEKADLLESRSNLGLMVDDDDVELREYFMLNYAQTLFSYSSLWESAIFYLSTCPTQGRAWMSQLILRIPTKDDATVTRLLQTCERFRLQEQHNIICRIAAKNYVISKDFAKAVKYYQIAQDVSSLSHISDQILDFYLDCGKLVCAEDLTTIKDQSVSAGGSFDFLLLYSQFREQLGKSDYQQASRLLLDLFTLPSSRKDLWPILFVDALVLFQDHSLFSQEDTFHLLYYLDQLSVFSRGGSAYFECLRRYIRSSAGHFEADQDITNIIDTFYQTVRVGLTQMLAQEFLV